MVRLFVGAGRLSLACGIVSALALSCAPDAGSAPGPSSSSSDAGADSGMVAPDAGPVDAIRRIEITTEGFVFDARAAGPDDGEVVFLLHGFPETSYEWRHQLPALARAGFRAIAPDQRGYSPRARPADVAEYGVLKLANDVLAMADAVGATRFHVVGHDWGSAVAWVVAGIAPDRVISATPMSVPHPDAFAAVLADKTSCQYTASSYFDFFTTPGATDFFVQNDSAGLRAAYEGVPAADVDVYVAALDRDAIDSGLNWYRANVANRNLNAPKLGAVKVPTLFIWSDKDTYLCRDGADLTASYVDAPYHLEVIPGVNHWIADNAPDALNTLLLAHLEKYRTK
jgi:pimeloyl-ACP methyl ester carboxylesterase